MIYMDIVMIIKRLWSALYDYMTLKFYFYIMWDFDFFPTISPQG